MYVISILQMFSVGPAFKGIKMIPPGIHFVYYSSSSRLVYCSLAVVAVYLHLSNSFTVLTWLDFLAFLCMHTQNAFLVFPFHVDLKQKLGIRTLSLIIYISYINLL